MNSKRKGSAGEREFAALLTAEGFPCHRNDQRFTGGYNNPDVAARGLEGYHFEIKRTERLNLGAAMEQAIQDSAGRVPVVASRRNRKPWLVSLRLTDFLNLIRSHHD